MDETKPVAPPKAKKGKVGIDKAKVSAKASKSTAETTVNKLTSDLAVAKKKLELAKKEETIVKNENVIIDEGDIPFLTPTIRHYLEEAGWDSENIIFKPNPGPQTEFLAASEREVLYGGARGGGKSYALVVDPLRYVDNPKHSALIIRRTMPELRDLIHISKELYGRAYPKARWLQQEKEWTFPSGARIKFGYCESLDDTMQFQGQAFNWIGMDEAGQYPDEEILNRLKGSLRTVDPSLPLCLRLTANPGGPGQWWLKKMFVEPTPWNTRFSKTIKLKTPRGDIEEEITRRFIPATVYDNPHLLHDNAYIAMLASLPDAQRRQWLEGDWDVTEGASFSEFDRHLHVCEPFKVPDSWTKFRAADWGYKAPACCLWFALDYDNNLYVYRELYTTGKNAEDFANLVLDMEFGETIRYGVLDASTWAQRGDVGPSIAETMIKLGCRWRQSDRSPKSRINGKLEVHRWLALNEDGEPRLKIFNNCTNLIRTLPALPMDPNNSEDVDTDAEDHAYDALRYGCMSRPYNPSHLLVTDNNNPTRPNRFLPADSVFGY